MGPDYVQRDFLRHSILAEYLEDYRMLVFLLVLMLNLTIHAVYSSIPRLWKERR